MVADTCDRLAKRAETRPCPICHDPIPIRLLEKHGELEMARVDEIIHQIGSAEVLADAEPDEGMTSRSRRSAVKARKSLSSRPSGQNLASTSELTLDQITKTVRTIRNHRKQRHAKLRELTREEDETQWWGGRHGSRRGESEEGTVCPVCGRVVAGDTDVVEAHVDSCLAHTSSLEQDTAHRSTPEGEDDDLQVDIDGEGLVESVTAGVSFRGTGFDIRDRNQQDVDEEIDVDGEDDVLFGAAQFTEGDIIPLANGHHDGDPSSNAELNTSAGHAGGRSTILRDLVATGKLVRRKLDDVGDLKRTMKRTMNEVMGIAEAEEVDQAIEKARRDKDDATLIQALESKVQLMVMTRGSSSTSLLCRICLDAYAEPTVSTGCWHTCCRECWLRCLGATKLCPICKRITAACELRRVYL
ncbi:hypothetical protein DAEQUDRAFT_744178 [Daedalea quercina L-15889]|uniref:RING-type domain-containing protein n=1 Tax=Daedalea quercina L-15889 TaxID=1314783 RepID=A0A165S394_9APHY|nr:hypothetical protein DAEQUDRAFT_744178 [Daedalea quercina L-15889]